jgi:hypothetical protein
MRLVVLLVYLSYIPSALSLLFIDISPYAFKTEGRYGLRILFFDTDAQHLRQVHYVPQQNKRTPDAVAFTHPLFDATFRGDVTLKQPFKTHTTALRTFGKLQRSGKAQTPITPPEKPLGALLRRLHAPPAKAVPVVRIFYGPQARAEARSFASISPDATTNRRERGILGELVTDLTFLAYGFVKKEAQNGSNQGLDGVFAREGEPYLMLTESKNRQESKKATAYMKSDLSEENLLNRVNEIPDRQLQAFILTRMDTTPWLVFKVVQRLKPSGAVESAVATLDEVRYFYARTAPMTTVPLPLQEALLRAVLRKLHATEATAENVVALVLYAPHARKVSYV